MRLVLSLSAAVGALLMAQASSCAAELEMQAGEIRLDGTIRSVSAGGKLLVMDALSFSLPNGKGTRFTAPKTKNVEINAAAHLHVRGDEKRGVSLNEIKAGALVIVIGKDVGSGKNLPAREVVVWDREENGKYFFGPLAPSTPVVEPKPEPPTPEVKPEPKPQPKPEVRPPAPPVVEEEAPVAINGEAAPALSMAEQAILQIRVKTRSANNAAPEIKLAPGVELPAALAKLSKPQHLFMFALTTPDGAPEDASATLSLPDTLGRPSPATLRVSVPRGMPGGMARPLPVEMYWGSGGTIPQGQPEASEVAAIFFGYFSHQTRAPETYDGAGAVALPVAPQRPAGAEPPAPPETTSAVGEYTLQTSYAGNAKFQIGASQDFLDGIEVNMPAETPDFSKALTLSWEKVPRALGYRVRTLGTKQPEGGGKLSGVLWTSSRVALSDVQDEQVFDDTARAVKDGLLLNANTTSVTIPAGVLSGMKSVSFIVEAFGPVKVIPGKPAVRIIPMSEKVFNLPFTPGEAGSGTGPRGRPRPPRGGGNTSTPVTPTVTAPLLTEPQAEVRISTTIYGRQSLKPDASPGERAAHFNPPYRNLRLLLAAKNAAREDLEATLKVPSKLIEGSNLPIQDALPLTIAVPASERGGSTPVPVKIYAGSGEQVADGQPLMATVTYEEISRLQSAQTNTEFNGVGSFASGPSPLERNTAPQLGARASAVSDYSLKTSYAGSADFSIAADQNFFEPLRVAISTPTPDMKSPLTISWPAIPGALGYHVYVSATQFHNTKDAIRVLWTPARALPKEARQLALPNDISQAIKDGILLGPDATSCVVPAGILAGAKEIHIVAQAYGPQRVVKATPGNPEVRIVTTSACTFVVDAP
jgi:hypothetical protein